MIKSIYKNLKYSIESYQGKKRTMFKWILLRAMNEVLTPLMIPIIIRVMLNTIEQGGSNGVALLKLVVFIVPILVLSYYIYFFSDAWMINSMYTFQEENIGALQKIPPHIVERKYTHGELSYIINASSWGMIQILMKIFRILGPGLSFLMFLFYSFDAYVFLGITLLLSLFVDIIFILLQGKCNMKYSKNMVEIEGEREEVIKNLVTNIEFYCVNEHSSLFAEENRKKREKYWKVVKRMFFLETILSFLHDHINVMYECLNYNVMEKEYGKGTILSGEIGSMSEVLGKARQTATLIKQEVVTVPQLCAPIERVRDMMRDVETKGKTLENTVIVAKGLTVVYNEKKVLDNVSFEIQPGEKVAIIGKNGSGKSTLIKTLLKIRRVTQGNLLLGDVMLEACSVIDLGKSISYVPAERRLFSELVPENVEMFSNHERDENRINEVLLEASFLEAEVKEMLEKNAYELSGGEAQRVSIARAIYETYPIYLFDEMTSSLDQENATNIIHMITSLPGTVIYTTHKKSEIDNATRVIMLKKGRIIADVEKDEFVNSSYFMSMWSE